jgi:hypothetical protein
VRKSGLAAAKSRIGPIENAPAIIWGDADGCKEEDRMMQRFLFQQIAT